MKTPVWYCPLCQNEGYDDRTEYCPNDGARVRPASERGAEWIDKVVGGKYKIVKFIQAGGMAEVFEAQHVDTGRIVAVKFLRAGLADNPEVAERFRQEAQMVALIAHPNVVALYDFGDLEEGGYYMVMELLKGLPLSDALDQGQISPRQACKIMLQACEGLAAAHERDVIHRDIKPDNLFLQVAGEGEDPVVKILDLGIGKLRGGASSNLTRSGTIFGTPAYMSPEQCLGEEAGPAVDIYGLGVVFYEMLLGRVPFQDPSYVTVLTQHVTELPEWDRELADNRGVPLAAETVVLKALSKRPEDRQESMLALQSDVAELHSRLRHGSRYSRPPTTRRLTTDPPPGSMFKILPLADSNGADNEVVEVVPDVYWVGRRHGKRLECNPYLRIFKGDDRQVSMLVDPGPPKDLDIVTDKVEAIIGSMEYLDYIFLNHQDPDVASNAAAIQQINAKTRIVCSEDTWRLAQFYGLDPKRFVPVESFRGNQTSLATGHTLQFIPTPFCHFRGAVAMYDPEARVLFSGDLFGGTTGNKAMVASHDHMAGIELFHEIYMPSKKAIAHAVSQVREIEDGVDIIAPQHGAIVTERDIDWILTRVASLQVGFDLIEANRSDPRYLIAANDMVREYIRINGEEETRKLLHSYSDDGSFSDLFLIEDGLEITEFRIEPRLALETLFRDALKAAPEGAKQDVQHSLSEALNRNLAG